MKNFRTYHKKPFHVDSILEIRLCMDSWEKITQVAAATNKSYSWVVRYCLFRLINRHCPDKFVQYGAKELSPNLSNRYQEFIEMDNTVLQRRANPLKHRHRLCLYEQDEIFIRIVAAKAGITMTHLVRFALELYLDKMLRRWLSPMPLSKRIFLGGFLFWLGIKIQHGGDFHTMSQKNLQFHFKRLQRYQYLRTGP